MYKDSPFEVVMIQPRPKASPAGKEIYTHEDISFPELKCHKNVAVINYIWTASIVKHFNRIMIYVIFIYIYIYKKKRQNNA